MTGVDNFACPIF